jgi:tetratricopeptide (TPR) repeat protein
MSHKPALWFLAWLLPLPICVSATTPVAAQTLDDYGRPLSPAEGRALNAEIIRLARVNVDSIKTIRAIARAIGLKSRNIDFDQLIKRVGEDAGRLPKLRTEIALLKGQIAVIKSAPVRDPAAMALTRAENALNEGRLDDADREFASLESLRKAESEESRIAWSNAVDARANVAQLRQEFDLAEKLRLSKSRFLISESKRNLHDAWKSAFEAAEARFIEGNNSLDNKAFERAVSIYRDEALPLVSRSEWPSDWAMTQHAIGRTLWLLGTRDTIGSVAFEEAIPALNNALELRTPTSDALGWAESKTILANVRVEIAQRRGGASEFEDAVKVYQEILDNPTIANEQGYRRGIQRRKADAFLAFGQRNSDTTKISDAIRIYENVLSDVNQKEESWFWASMQVSRANAYEVLFDQDSNAAHLTEAEKSYRAARDAVNPKENILTWVNAQRGLATTLFQIGSDKDQAQPIENAIAIYRDILKEYTFDRNQSIWADTNYNLAIALKKLGEIERDSSHINDSLETIENSLKIYSRSNSNKWWVNSVCLKSNLLLYLGFIKFSMIEYNKYELNLKNATSDARKFKRQGSIDYCTDVFIRASYVRGEINKLKKR